jgi:hypothetical protein
MAAMKLTPDEMSLLLKGRRLVSESDGQAYFDYVATLLRMGNTSAFDAVRNAVQMFTDATPIRRRR